MAVDIYVRNPYEPTYFKGVLEVTDDLDLFLQQIEMVLLTPKGSVLGIPDFGCSLDTYLWDFGASPQQIESEVQRQIYTYCSLSRQIPFSVEARMETDGIYDYCIVDIIIEGRRVLGIRIS